MLYNVGLVSAIHQHKSAIGIHMSPPCSPPFHFPRPVDIFGGHFLSLFFIDFAFPSTSCFLCLAWKQQSGLSRITGFTGLKITIYNSLLATQIWTWRLEGKVWHHTLWKDFHCCSRCSERGSKWSSLMFNAGGRKKSS